MYMYHVILLCFNNEVGNTVTWTMYSSTTHLTTVIADRIRVALYLFGEAYK